MMKSEEENSSTKEVDLSMNSGPETCSSASETETPEKVEEVPFTKVTNRKRKNPRKVRKHAAPAKLPTAIATTKKQEGRPGSGQYRQHSNCTVHRYPCPIMDWRTCYTDCLHGLQILTRRGLTKTLI